MRSFDLVMQLRFEVRDQVLVLVLELQLLFLSSSDVKTLTTTKRGNCECIATANALQLEEARRCAVPLRFNFVARAKFEVAQPIRCHLRAYLLLIRYATL